MPEELTKALLLEEAASQKGIAEALFVSVTDGIALVQALTETRAISPEVLARYLARSEAPFLRHVAPLVEVLDRLPPGLCARLLALPVRRDAITGTIDVVVADPGDEHPGQEIAYHLGAPVRLVRAAPAAIEEALRRLRRSQAPAPGAPVPGSHAPAAPVFHAPVAPPPGVDPRDDERIFDSRPRAAPAGSFRGGTLPPPAPAMTLGSHGPPGPFDAMTSEALRPSRLPAAERQAHVVPGASAAPRRETRGTPALGHSRA